MTSENTAPVSEREEWTAWLIERDGQWYAAAPHSRWTTQQAIDANTWRENWTSDANKALRFARKRDAETLIRYEGWQNAVATEHIWLAREEWPDLRDPRNIRAALRQAQDNVALSASQSTDSADTPHEQNTPSTPPDTPEALKEHQWLIDWLRQRDRAVRTEDDPHATPYSRAASLLERLLSADTPEVIGDEVVRAAAAIYTERGPRMWDILHDRWIEWADLSSYAKTPFLKAAQAALSALHQAGKPPATGGEG